jgi:broad specificity phosphatase PhoE
MIREPTSFVLVRHGHTAANGGPAGMRMSGWTDTPLSEEGRREARLVAEALRRGPACAALYASPLVRAVDTAGPICAALGLPVRIAPGLREIFCGAVDGLGVEEVRTRYPEAWARNLEERHEGFRWPEGESYRELRARCLRTLRALAARHPGERVLLVTHAGFISQAFGWLEGLSCARWSAYRPANGSLSWVLWGPGRGRGEGFDERAHLTPRPRPTPPPPAG